MKRFVFVLTMVLSAVVFAQEKPRAYRASLQEGGHKVAAEFGQYGAWRVDNGARWEALAARFKALNLKISDQLGQVDFAKDDLVCVFHYGDEGDTFKLHKLAGDEKQIDVQFVMGYIIYKQRRGMSLGVWQVLAVPVKKSAAARISVSTYHPMNGGPHPDPEKALLEWQWNVSPQTGEAIGGLSAAIEPQALAIKPGDDIVMKFTLAADQAIKSPYSHFAPLGRNPVHVWDGKYSNGYRNHGFEVITPDGRVQLLKPAVIGEWRKNIPHPVQIVPDKPYLLPNWVEGSVGKSLKQLGLDTSKPGRYTITGVYEEAYEPIQDNHPEIWGGVLRSNSIVIEVR